MTDESLRMLEDLKNGESISRTKDTANEIKELLSNLKNIGILYKNEKNAFACEFKNRKYLSKLIELKSLTDFLNWLDGQNTDLIISNNFSGSTIGQVNQSSGNIDLKSPIKQNIKNRTDKIPKTKSFLEIASWIIGIIAAGIGIYEFIIKKIIS
jgi:hypothetical protein